MRKISPHWAIQGIVIGIVMYLISEIIFPLIAGEGYSQRQLLTGIPIWLAGGMTIGFFNNLFSKKKKKDDRS